MWEFLNRFDNSSLVFLAVMLPLVAALAIVLPIVLMLTFRQQSQLKEQEDALKREMLAKGMSAEEIERVIHATAGGTKSATELLADTAASPKGPGFDKARIVMMLATHGMEAAGIEQVLRVLVDYPDEEMPAKVVAVESLAKMGMEAADIERVIRAFQPTPGSAAVPPDARKSAFRE
jgi:SOS response regulatory protein OraA/RecX